MIKSTTVQKADFLLKSVDVIAQKPRIVLHPPEKDKKDAKESFIFIFSYKRSLNICTPINEFALRRGWIWKFGSTMVFTPNMRAGGFVALRMVFGWHDGLLIQHPSIDGICWWMDSTGGQLRSQNDLALRTNSSTSSYSWTTIQWPWNTSCFLTRAVLQLVLFQLEVDHICKILLHAGCVSI